MDVAEIAKDNMDDLASNSYPGRGVVVGLTPDARHYVQVYWIMGRSENSRNRLFVVEGDLVRTAPWDESKVQDPSLIIYNCGRIAGRAHIVSNGDQTDTIYDALEAGGTFEAALCTRTFEPDAPNFTPRISGLVDLDDELHACKLSILKAVQNSPDHCARQFFCYETCIRGVGHCIHTYNCDGAPLPAFEGEPYLVELADDIDDVTRRYWEALNEDNRVALLAKFIDRESGATDIRTASRFFTE